MITPPITTVAATEAASDIITVKLGDKEFPLDRRKAEAAFQAKRILNGRQTPAFNLLPLRYPWAYEMYCTMRDKHWEPTEVAEQMTEDVKDWASASPEEKWIIKMGLGYFSAAEGIVGDNVLHVTRELVTAPELKLVLGRHAHEENVHADSLLFLISSLGVDPHECEAIFEQIPSVRLKNEFVTRHTKPLRGNADTTRLEVKRDFVLNMFVYGCCMEGTQFYALFAMILSLYRQGRFRGVANIFRWTLTDEAQHVQLFTNLINGVFAEEPDLSLKEMAPLMHATMREAVTLEHAFIDDCMAGLTLLGNTPEDYKAYVEFMADIRLRGVNLPPLYGRTKSPLPWLEEGIQTAEMPNFFEKKPTDYQRVSAVRFGDDTDY